MKEENKTTELMIIDSLPDQFPEDFYTNNQYRNKLIEIVKNTSSLVYQATDEGEKQSKKDMATINKVASKFKAYAKKAFDQETKEQILWKDGFKELISALLDNRSSINLQFEESRKKKLAFIQTELKRYLDSERQRLKIDTQFQSENTFDGLLNLTGTLTAAGNLTKKAVDLLNAHVQKELKMQTMVATRKTLIENSCLKAGINPPLSPEQFSYVIYDQDDDVFAAELDSLITIELERIEQSKINQKLKEAREEKRNNEIAEEIKKQDNKFSDNQPNKDQNNGKRAVFITIRFKLELNKKPDIDKIKSYIKTKITPDLLNKMTSLDIE